jgi:hypothetical protein
MRVWPSTWSPGRYHRWTARLDVPSAQCALRAWLDAAGISSGAVFRKVDRGCVGGRRLHERSVALVVKRRISAAGLDPRPSRGLVTLGFRDVGDSRWSSRRTVRCGRHGTATGREGGYDCPPSGRHLTDTQGRRPGLADVPARFAACTPAFAAPSAPPSSGKAPALVADLKRMLDRLPGTCVGLRDRALLLVGFAGAFRRSELISLNVADLEFAAPGWL